MVPKLIDTIYHSFQVSFTKSVIRTTVVLSVLAHIFFFLSMQTVIPSYWKKTELKTYRVDLMRLEIRDIPDGLISDTVLEENQKEDVPAEESEDTISLDTKDKRYISYASAIKKKIMENWQYPARAQAYLIEGSTMIRFTILRSGEIDTIVVTSGSGHDMLDDEAVRAVKKCIPFPPFPSSIKVQRLNINAAFVYRLTSSGEADDGAPSGS